MKKFELFAILTVIFFACNRNDQETPEPTDFGYLTMNIAVTITAEPVNGRVEAVSTDEWKVTIFKVDGTVAEVFDPYMDAPSEIQLPTGEYYVEAHSNNFMEAAFENPYYFGRSDNFTIDKEELKTIEIDAELANSKVAIHYSSNVTSTFNDYTGAVTVKGTGTTLVYGQGETREGYFVSVPLSVVINLSYTKLDGSFITREFNAEIDAQPKTLYNINVDATLADGEIVLNINVDEGFETVEIELGDSAPPGGLEGCLLTDYLVYEGNDVERWEMTYNMDNQIEVIDKSDNYGGTPRQWSLGYDNQGRLVSAESSGGSVSREEFIYDDDQGGILVRRNRLRQFNGVWDLTDYDVYAYTGNQITSISKYEPDLQGVFGVTRSQTFTYMDETNNPVLSEEFESGVLTRRINYTYDDKINPIRSSGLWICQDCIDFEYVPFTDNNLTYRFVDNTNDQDDITLTATYTINQYGYPTQVIYDNGGPEFFQQLYMYECEGPQDLDSDGDGIPDISEFPGCQDNPRC